MKSVDQFDKRSATTDDRADWFMSQVCGCKKCGGTMKPSKALQQTYTSGMPDFPGDDVGVTISAGGPGKLIDCLKCEKCGWSVTASKEGVK